MIERALDAGAPAAWVAADEVYGHDSKLRRWLEGRQLAYVLAVASDQRLWQPILTQHRVDAIAQSLPDSGWKRLSAGFGSKGERLYDWAMISALGEDGWTHGAAGAAQYRRKAGVRLLSLLRSHRQRPRENAGPSGRTTLADRAML